MMTSLLDNDDVMVDFSDSEGEEDQDSRKLAECCQETSLMIETVKKEAAEIQYFGVRELMYQYNIEEEKWCIAYYTKKHPTAGGWNTLEQESLHNTSHGVSTLHTLAVTLVTNCSRHKGAIL